MNICEVQPELVAPLAAANANCPCCASGAFVGAQARLGRASNLGSSGMSCAHRILRHGGQSARNRLEERRSRRVRCFTFERGSRLI